MPEVDIDVRPAPQSNYQDGSLRWF